MPRKLHFRNKCHNMGQNSRCQENFTFGTNITIMVRTVDARNALLSDQCHNNVTIMVRIVDAKRASRSESVSR